MASAPAGLDEEEVELMVRKYRDPERKGLVNCVTTEFLVVVRVSCGGLMLTSVEMVLI